MNKIESVKKYKSLVYTIVGWITDAEKEYYQNNKEYALESCINGIENYLGNKGISLDNILKEINEKEIYILKLRSVVDNPKIYTSEVKERIDNFTSQIQQAIENNKPIENLEDINKFIEYLDKLVINYQKEQAEKEYIKEALFSSIDKSSEGGDGSINGSINDIPVSIRIENDNNVFFNIDESKGDYRVVLEEID